MKKHIIFMLGVLLGGVIAYVLFMLNGLSVQSESIDMATDVYSIECLCEDAPDIKNNTQNNKVKTKDKIAEDISIEEQNQEQDQQQYQNRWNITLTEEEIDLLARIVMLEAGGESDWGKDAVVEVIFNRMYDEDFPDTLVGVLSDDKCGVQFSTWKNRNCDAATPTDEVYESIYCVLSGQTDVLPFETVYFSKNGEPGKEVQITIENHTFCNK